MLVLTSFKGFSWSVWPGVASASRQWRSVLVEPQGGGASNGGLYREASPERGAFFKLAVYERVGKIAILVYERVTKSAAKWKKWWLRRSISKGATFWQK